jgi:tetratricopeptide (TPR) repeat protein
MVRANPPDKDDLADFSTSLGGLLWATGENRYEFYARRAQMRSLLKDWPGVLEDTEHLASKYGGNAFVYQLQGTASRQLARFGEALDSFEKAAAALDGDARYSGLDDIDKALQDKASRALQRAGYLRWAAELAARLSKPGKARALAKQAIAFADEALAAEPSPRAANVAASIKAALAPLVKEEP